MHDSCGSGFTPTRSEALPTCLVMADDRSSRISDLYERALAHPPAERERFLHDACGDDDGLRREVQSLLEFESDSEKFLERPAAAILAASPMRRRLRRQRRPPRQNH